MITIYLGSDHGGLNMKNDFALQLRRRGFDVRDMGTHDKDPADYPLYAQRVAESVVKNPGSFGVLFCKTGIGMMMAANKIPGVRAAPMTDKERAKLTREHNNANILCVGAGYTTVEDVIECLTVFVKTPFSTEERHTLRVDSIEPRSKKGRFSHLGSGLLLASGLTLIIYVIFYYTVKTPGERSLVNLFMASHMSCYVVIGLISMWTSKSEKPSVVVAKRS